MLPILALMLPFLNQHVCNIFLQYTSQTSLRFIRGLQNFNFAFKNREFAQLENNLHNIYNV